MGNIQLLGKLQAGMLTAAVPLVPRPILQGVADRSVDWWVMSEDLPDPKMLRHLSRGWQRAGALEAEQPCGARKADRRRAR